MSNGNPSGGNAVTPSVLAFGAAIVAAGRASVQRWQLAQVVQLFPQLLPDTDDLGIQAAERERGTAPPRYSPPSTHRLNDLTARLPASVVNLAPVLGRLLHAPGPLPGSHRPPPSPADHPGISPRLSANDRTPTFSESPH